MFSEYVSPNTQTRGSVYRSDYRGQCRAPSHQTNADVFLVPHSSSRTAAFLLLRQSSSSVHTVRFLSPHPTILPLAPDFLLLPKSSSSSHSPLPHNTVLVHTPTPSTPQIWQQSVDLNRQVSPPSSRDVTGHRFRTKQPDVTRQPNNTGRTAAGRTVTGGGRTPLCHPVPPPVPSRCPVTVSRHAGRHTVTPGRSLAAIGHDRDAGDVTADVRRQSADRRSAEQAGLVRYKLNGLYYTIYIGTCRKQTVNPEKRLRLVELGKIKTHSACWLHNA